MMLAQAVDVTGEDQGLNAVLDARQVQAVVKTYLTAGCGIGTTTDFLGYFMEQTFETEIKTLLEAKFPVGDPSKDEGVAMETQRLYISRLRGAYRLALEVDKRIKQEAALPQPPKDEEANDLEKPMDPTSIERLDSTWTATHQLKFINFMKPAPQFRNKMFRELHMRTARLLQVEKVQSLEDNRLASEPEKVDIGAFTSDGSKLVLESARNLKRKVTDCLEYLTALRILMQTYAYVGSHMVPSATDPDRQIVFFPLEVAVAYVDETTMCTVAMRTLTERDRLDWLRKRDEQVRGEMVALINEGCSGGEALTRASQKLAHIWLIRDGATAVSSGEGSERRGQTRPRSEQGGKSQGKNADNAKKGRTDALGGVKRVTTYNGTKYCGAFNGKKGCVWNEQNCPQHAKHMCSVVLPSGEICRSTRHGAAGHR